MKAEVAFGVAGLEELIRRLRGEGYTVVGPRVRDGAIVYDELSSAAQLPRGWTEKQEKGTYRLVRRDDDALFGFTVGPIGVKSFLFPAREKLWAGARRGNGFRADPPDAVKGPFAFLGVRACDWAAVGIQDRVFLGGPHRDERYGERREKAFFVGVQCSVAAPTCFCTSMGTGPAFAPEGAPDVILTEIVEGRSSRFVAQGRSERGEKVLRDLGEPAPVETSRAAAAVVERCRHEVETRGRRLDAAAARAALVASPEHTRWDEVAERCINCANCTLVCPTCFCSTVEDVTDLQGEHAERWRRWDSCFTLDHSYLHGGSVRASARSRYRQWATHKLSTWWEQFDTSGCVGCGRCLAWCPVGIDLTEEAGAIAAPGQQQAAEKGGP